jgi:hypothetical protein
MVGPSTGTNDIAVYPAFIRTGTLSEVDTLEAELTTASVACAAFLSLRFMLVRGVGKAN